MGFSGNAAKKRKKAIPHGFLQRPVGFHPKQIAAEASRIVSAAAALGALVGFDAFRNPADVDAAGGLRRTLELLGRQFNGACRVAHRREYG